MKQKQRWGNGERHQSQRCVQTESDIDHRCQFEAGRDERNQPVHGHILDRGGIVLDAISGISRAAHIVVGNRKALGMMEQFRSKIENKLFSGISTKQRSGNSVKLVEYSETQQQANCQTQHCRWRLRHRQWQERI